MAKEDITSITKKSLNKYLGTYNIAYLNNAVDYVIGSSGAFTIGSTGKKSYEVSRYRSWDHCYVYFQYLHKKQQEGNDLNPEEKDLNPEEKDLACLYLAYYLASWGMYRGSSFVLDFDYKIYEKVVEEILKANNVLWDLDGELKTLNSTYAKDIYDFINKGKGNDHLYEKMKVFSSDLDVIVKEIYQLGDAIDKALRDYKIYDNNKYYLNSVIDNSNIIVSTTLITKIMLGTIGCMPAFDTNFRKGIGFSDSAFREDYIAYVLLIAIINYTDLASIQSTVGDVKDSIYYHRGSYPYSIMKLLDIYYFTRGAENFLKQNIGNWAKNKKKAIKSISQVCYRKNADLYTNNPNDYDVKLADPLAKSLESDIRRIVDKNKNLMRKYCDGERIKDEELND